MKIFVSVILMLVSLFGFSQSPTRGALVTVDTSNFSNSAGFTRPTIKMLAVNKLDNAVVFWDLSSWNTIGGGVNIYNSDGTLIGDRTVNGGGYNLNFTNNASFFGYGQTVVGMQSDDGTYTAGLTGQGNLIQLQSEVSAISNYGSQIGIVTDSIYIRPFLGRLNIDTLNAQSNASDSMLVWATSGSNRGRVGYKILPTSGTYTPTLTNTTNVAASTAYVTSYMRVGNVVTVGFKVDIDATLAASTATLLGFSLPIASNFTAEEDAGGTAASDIVANLVVRIKADATNDGVSLVFKSLSLTNDSYNGSFTYIIK